ncbi:MAG: ThiF family adenylyltransferase [Deltaproteobacteria bacterium]|nr:ThiF family adenylyltransferase [Deltaproteobacteria bacterium]
MLRATVIGAGGLGGPIARSLARAGIEVAIVDHDVVELSNLHRQTQFTGADLGAPKAEALAARIRREGGTARAYPTRWRADDTDEHTLDADLLVDGSDDPATKFAAADWAVEHGRCYVIAAALRYGGNAFAGAPGAACYRCLFEDPDPEAPSCADAGVLGPVVAAIGGVAAALAIGLARGDRRHAGALFAFDDLRRSPDPRIVRFAARRDCPTCLRAPLSPFAAPVLLADREAPP